MSTTNEFVAGTKAQHDFISSLAGRLGFESAIAACAAALGRDHASLLAQLPSKTEAREVINHLQGLERQKPTDSSATATKGAGKSSSGHYTTAKQLREMAAGARATPSDLDEHARWVLDRLA